MKQLIIFIISVLATIAGAQAQCNAEYKSFERFDNDTIAYLYNNFEKRADCYKGKTIKDVIKDLELPILNYELRFAGDYVTSISLHVMNVEKGTSNPLEDYYIVIGISAESLNGDEVVELRKTYPREKWVPEHYEFFKDAVVKGVWFNPYMKDLMKERQLWKYN